MSEEDFWDDDDVQFPSEQELRHRLRKLGIRCPMCDEYFWSGRQRQDHMLAVHRWGIRLDRNAAGRPHKGFCHCGRNYVQARGLCNSCITRERRALTKQQQAVTLLPPQQQNGESP